MTKNRFEKLLRDRDWLLADGATRRFVSPPNAFLSHAWQYRFKDVVEALEAFGDNEELFFWFDCF